MGLLSAPELQDVINGAGFGEQECHGIDRKVVAFLFQLSRGIGNDKGLLVTLAGIAHLGLDAAVRCDTADHQAVGVEAI